MNQKLVVLPRWALWDHPEQKQTFMQTPNSSPHPTRRNLLQLQCRTSHQEFANWKSGCRWNSNLHIHHCGNPLSILFCFIKFASLNLVFQMLSFGNFPQWSLYLILQKWPDRHLTPSLNQPQVLVVLSSGPTPMDTTSSSNFTLMVLDPLRANMHQFYSPSSLATTTICFNGFSRRSSTLVSAINWIHWTHGRKQFSQIKTRSTRNPQSQQNRGSDNHDQQLYSSL